MSSSFTFLLESFSNDVLFIIFRKTLQRMAATVLAAASLGFVASQNPRWEPTWDIQLSTMSMFMNFSGWTDPKYAGQFGVSSFDWSNGKEQWANQKPMDCEERLVTQATWTKKQNPAAKVYVYRNLVKALPWYTSVREKLDDPRYSGFFLKFKPGGYFPNGTYHVPQCTYEKCSEFYHDQEQTPAVPTPQKPSPDGACTTGEPPRCDCGNNPCGEYLWDHRNGTMLRDFLVNEFVLGNTSIGHPDIDGLFIDDFWCSDIINGTGSCTDPVQGGSEEDRHQQVDMGLSDKDISMITKEWLTTMTQVQEAMLEHKAYTWSIIPGQANANAMPEMISKNSCSKMVRETITSDKFENMPLLFGLSADKSGQFLNVKEDVAAFQLMRGPYAWIGLGQWGMAWKSTVQFPSELKADYGKPLSNTTESSTNVFTREYSKATFTLDCNTFKATINMH